MYQSSWTPAPKYIGYSPTGGISGSLGRRTSNFRRNCQAALFGIDKSLLTTYCAPSPDCSRGWFPGMAAPCPPRFWPSGEQLNTGRGGKVGVPGRPWWETQGAGLPLAFRFCSTTVVMSHGQVLGFLSCMVGIETVFQQLLRALEAT